MGEGVDLEGVRESSDALSLVRREADERAREAIDALEDRLRRALNYQRLRGLADLGGFYGLRVTPDGSMFALLPSRKAVAALDALGNLVLVTRFEKAVVFAQKLPRAMRDARLLEAFVRAVAHAAEIHVESARKRTADFEKVADLGRRITSALL